MTLKDAKRRLAELDWVRADVVRLAGDKDEAVAVRGDLEDLLVPIDKIRSTMQMRIAVLEEATA